MTGDLEDKEDRYKGDRGLDYHHQELRHDVGGDDLHWEDSSDPGPFQQTLRSLCDEGL